MKKYTIIAAMLFGLAGTAFAQDSSSSEKSEGSSASYAPAAGDLSGAILFGRGNFLNAGLAVPGSQTPYWRIAGTAPYGNTVDANNNDVTNIVGVEMRYFLQPNIALKVSGGAILRDTPARTNIPGVVIEGPDGMETYVPAQDAVIGDNSADINVNIGGEYFFASKYSRLMPYTGVTIPFYYARRTLYDPTIISEPDGQNPGIVDMGPRHAEIFGFGGQLVAGVDYYLMEGMYFGFEVKPVSYVYSYSNKYPAPGMEVAQAENSTFSFFSQTFLKVGFRF